MGAGINVVLHNKETPQPTMMLKGVRSMGNVPGRIEGKGKQMPTTLTKEEALAIQKDTMEYYKSPLLQAQLKQLQAKTLENWQSKENIDLTTQREYNKKLGPILQPHQAKFFPKHGFEATSKGMSLMQGIFNNEYNDDQDIQDNVNTINAIVGTDFSWVPPDLQARLFSAAAPAGGDAATPAVE